jgi:RsiW-degrading membrane proteinase PrsW (M82 family)
MTKYFRKYAGVIIGAIYALILRLIFNIQDLSDTFSLFTITFIWLTPIIIGLIPLFYASDEQLKSWGFRIASPIWTVIIFFFYVF